MSRMELSVNAHVFHASLRFKTSILVDEKDKKIFLDFALRSQGEPEMVLLSFVILDNEAHFLFGLRKEKRGSKKAMQTIMKNYKKFLEKEYCQGNDRDLVEFQWEILKEKEEILNTCREIHLLPVERGYVKRARDYWWSGFQTYRGTYQWRGMDILPILQCFAANGKISRGMFLRYHKQES